ncbi:hypothetical protein [Pseudomonas sp. CC6-YY-74]|uniref:hypothetical protein n=1 Tax=Pseudomonas sp. CC6-YY-74 TaxID=1930532 RepID=UPI0012ABB658|nr:hypothetical protein [Pseudomonas sp. CC6-YY-74]
MLTRTGPVEVDPQLLLGAAACLIATTGYGFSGFLTRCWIGQQSGQDNASPRSAGSAVPLFLLPLLVGA